MAMNLKTTIGAIILIFAWACTEEIDIDLDRNYTRLVVDGGITNDQLHHMVRLTTSTDYFYNQEPPPVTGATVFVTFDNKSVKLTELSGVKGLYALPEAYAGEPGKTYQLDIRLRNEIGGATSYKASTMMPSTDFHLDSIQMEYNSRFDFWLVKVYAKDPPTTDFYKFETYLNSLRGNDTTMRTTATPDRFFNGRNTNGFSVAFFEGELLAAGDTITTAMSAVTEDYFNFYSELRSEAGFNNPLFDGPPANIRTNVKPGGLGYFYARKTARVKLIVPDWRKE
jgi:hypothetical protein